MLFFVAPGADLHSAGTLADTVVPNPLVRLLHSAGLVKMIRLFP